MPDAFDYSVFDEALDLIAEFGRDVQLTPEKTVLVDPERPWEGHRPAAPITVRAVVTGFSRRLVAAGAVQAGDQRVTIDSRALEAKPTAAWSYRDRGQDFRIVSVIESIPGPASLVYVLQVRK